MGCSKKLREHLPQLFDYLRRLCLQYRYGCLFGVLTNYESWLFVRFDLLAEVAVVEESRLTNDQMPAKFEVAQEIKLLGADRSVQLPQLGQIVHIIEFCCHEEHRIARF